jgi:hypothetical protein
LGWNRLCNYSVLIKSDAVIILSNYDYDFTPNGSTPCVLEVVLV